MGAAAARHAPRVWLPSASPLVPGRPVALPAGAVSHLRVLRASPGSPLALFNSRDGEFSAALSAARRGVADVGARVRAPPPAGAAARRPTLAVPCLSDRGALSALFDGATALGVGAFLLLETDRAQARWAAPPGDEIDDDGGGGGGGGKDDDAGSDGADGSSVGDAASEAPPAAVAAVLAAAGLALPARARAARSAARLRRVAVAAAEQSGGLFVPDVLAPRGLSLARWLAGEAAAARAGARATLTLVLDNISPWPRVRDALAAEAEGARRHVVIAVGPEGGWSGAEAAALGAARAGASLGPRALRSELAAVAALVDAAAWPRQEEEGGQAGRARGGAGQCEVSG